MEFMIGRRKLVKASAIVLASLTVGRTVFSAEGGKEEKEEINPAEDLMREHGVLRRILLIYRNLITHLDASKEISWAAAADAAGIVRTFVEDYHEKLEERYVFPAMRKAGKLTGIVDILVEQHRAGRRLTDEIIGIAGTQGNKPDDAKRARTVLSAFIRMYEPHAAREDTVLFPEVHAVWRTKEFAHMGDVFEKEEDRLFGDRGFEKMVDRVAGIEKQLGIYDLGAFTPTGDGPSPINK